MKITYSKIFIALLVFTLAACHENPKNTFGGPSNNPQDTAASRRDTSATGLRTDGHEAN
jgi:hypothetical protein